MDVIGGGVLVAVAATLWIAYLLPSWLRRKQYLATERNAVRLQQTLRILHEHEELARLEAEAAANLAIAERIAAEEAADAARALALQAMATHPIATLPAPAARSAEPVAVQAVPDAAASAPARARTARSLRRRRALCS